MFVECFKEFHNDVRDFNFSEEIGILNRTAIALRIRVNKIISIILLDFMSVLKMSR